MDIETVSNKGFQVVIPHGDLTINALASLTPALTSIINEHPENDLVFDFSKVTSIDTSTAHLLLNIRKRLESAHRKQVSS